MSTSKDEPLDKIVQDIEIDSMIAISKSAADGDERHHLEMIGKSKKSIEAYVATEVLKELKDMQLGHDTGTFYSKIIKDRVAFWEGK